MKKILKKEFIVGLVVGIVLASSIAVYAAVSASQVTYKDGKTVEYALNDLYTKVNKTSQQVATITTQGQSYTFQNDGYVLGTIKADYNVASGIIYFGEHDENEFDGGVSIAPYSSNATFNVRLYATKGTTLYTRKSYGTYNITLYEFK